MQGKRETVKTKGDAEYDSSGFNLSSYPTSA